MLVMWLRVLDGRVERELGMRERESWRGTLYRETLGCGTYYPRSENQVTCSLSLASSLSHSLSGSTGTVVLGAQLTPRVVVGRTSVCRFVASQVVQ